MKLPPRLRIEPSPSRIGPRALASMIVATALIAFVAIDNAYAGAMAVIACAAVGLQALRELQRTPLLMHVGMDRRIRVTLRDGRVVEGTVHTDTSVGAWLTAIVWRQDGARWFVPARTLLVLPDMLAADDFRRLRIYLRYGRVAPEAETSGVSAP